MKHIIPAILAGLMAAICGHAQLRSGLTGIPDTSYSIQREFEKHRKKYPGLKVVLPAAKAVCRTDTAIIYDKTPEQVVQLDVYQPFRKQFKRERKQGLTALIFIHGGGWRSGNRTMHQAMLEQLAAKGYVCISPSYRLSTVALYPAAIHDIKAVIRWTRAHAVQYHINPERIVIAGHSAGGELAAFMASTNGNPAFEGQGCHPEQSSRVNAAIDMDGTLAFIHPESGEGGDEGDKISAGTYWFGYRKNERPDIWTEAGPLTHAGCHNVPVLFINSSVARMHAGRTDFIQKMDSCGIYTAVKTFEDAPHSFCFFEPWFTPSIEVMDAFIRKIWPAALISKKNKNAQTK